MKRNISPANISSHQDRIFNHTFNDYYFVSNTPILEAETVFLKPNQLIQRWHSNQNSNQNKFVIVETGFGLGINFLVTCEAFLRESIGQKLHYIAFEMYPFTKQQLINMYKKWPKIRLQQELINFYPNLIFGIHELALIPDKLTLTLFFSPLINSLPSFKHYLNNFNPNYSTHVDAWYLDGFAPAKNPTIWSEQLFKCMAQYANKETTFATFTAASKIRQQLISVGFKVEKIKGFGSKREMLRGTFQSTISNQNNRL